jgi:phosphoglycerate dehydrogenase-like enzyme
MKSDEQRPRVLICDRIHPAGVELLREVADVDDKKVSPAELLTMIDEYDAVVVRSGTQITEDVIRQGTRLKVIGRAGAGLDNIAVSAAQNRGIKVVNCPDANTLAVAEHTLALLLALARHLPDANRSLKEGKWEKNKLMGTGLTDKVLGIIGFGRIGRQVAVRAKAFGMRVLVNQHRSTPELNLKLEVEAVDLLDLLREADFVSLHVPAKPETQLLIGAEQLALMKPTAYLINTARGSVVDEDALLAALDAGQIAGAALDVFAEEPATHSELVQHERVIATPHIAASTEDAQQEAAIAVARQVIEVLRDGQFENPLSLQVVSLDKVFAHENVDPHRVQKLAERLAVEDVLVNPPVVIGSGDHYVVLDGATRTAALKQLDYPHTIVQVVSDKDKLVLHTWFHAIRKSDPAKLVKMLDDLPEVSLIESKPQSVLDEMIEYGGLCYLHTVNDKVFRIEPAAGVNRLDALNKLTTAYIEACYLSRTLTKDIKTLQQEYPDLTALVVFPEYTVDQILQIAQAGQVVPAGITRFIIPGRVLRINADLDYLKSERSLSEKARWLNRLVMNKLLKGEIRYYEEPVYLLDE